MAPQVPIKGVPLQQHPRLVAFAGSPLAYTPAPGTAVHNTVVFVASPHALAMNQEFVNALIRSSADLAVTGMLGRSYPRPSSTPVQWTGSAPRV